jgi:hypothetical protein
MNYIAVADKIYIRILNVPFLTKYKTSFKKERFSALNIFLNR